MILGLRRQEKERSSCKKKSGKWWRKEPYNEIEKREEIGVKERKGEEVNGGRKQESGRKDVKIKRKEKWMNE